MFSVKSTEHSCCTVQPKTKMFCPKCQQKAKAVLSKTLNHLLKDTIKLKFNSLEGFHYCETATCEVVYFRDNEILLQDDLMVIVGLKKDASPTTICYCFDWTKEKIAKELKQKQESSALADIKNKMKSIGCSCEILNPSGRCCLADVSHAIKTLEKELEL